MYIIIAVIDKIRSYVEKANGNFPESRNGNLAHALVIITAIVIRLLCLVGLIHCE